MNQALILDIAVAVVAVAKVLDWFGYLPKKKSAADAAGELDIADRRNDRLAQKVVDLQAQNAKLEATRSLEPLQAQILELIKSNGENQAQILDRLIHHNGSFQHMERSLSTIHESLKMLAGFIASVADVPPIATPAKRKRKDAEATR